MADAIKTPILLVHGDADNNPGTHTMQARDRSAARASERTRSAACARLFRCLQVAQAAGLAAAAGGAACLPVSPLTRSPSHPPDPVQSERMYSALKGHGCPTRLVLLPHESHGYGARRRRGASAPVRALRRAHGPCSRTLRSPAP